VLSPALQKTLYVVYTRKAIIEPFHNFRRLSGIEAQTNTQIKSKRATTGESSKKRFSLLNPKVQLLVMYTTQFNIRNCDFCPA